jgi:hypothetical protein
MHFTYPHLSDPEDAKRQAARDYTPPPSFNHRSIHLFCPRIESSMCKVHPNAHLWTESPNYVELS